MAAAGDKKRGFIMSFIDAFHSYAEERKRPRVCPVCGQEVGPIGDGEVFACRNASCGWQGTSPTRG